MTALSESPDDFEIARDVFEKLRHLQRERQERVLRWVTEGLGMPSLTTLVTPPLASTLRTIVPDSSGTTTLTPAILTPTDIKTFVEVKKPKSDQQFAAAVAYYYRFEAPPGTAKGHHRHQDRSGRGTARGSQAVSQSEEHIEQCEERWLSGQQGARGVRHQYRGRKPGGDDATGQDACIVPIQDTATH